MNTLSKALTAAAVLALGGCDLPEGENISFNYEMGKVNVSVTLSGADPATLHAAYLRVYDALEKGRPPQWLPETGEEDK